MLIEFEFEPIYDVLKRIETHPELIIAIKSPYKNVVQVFIPDTTPVEHAAVHFPSNKLMVNRLPIDFIKSPPTLFAVYWESTVNPLPSLDEFWAMTAHLLKEKD